jgi:hypothetical protein
MWHTNNGDRTLEGAEARLFAETLWNFVSELEGVEGDYGISLRVFDRLTYGQKASMLSTIGAGLLMPDVPICKLTANVEGAIAAMFEYLQTAVIIEIDEPEFKSNWRKMILAVRRKSGAEELPNEDCEDEEEWLIEIEELSAMILWDADYEDEDLYIDKPPEEARALKDFMRIREEYFTEVPEDLKPNEIKAKLSELKDICLVVCEKYEI